MKLIIIFLLYFLTNLPVRGQELNVEQTLAYINKQLNDENNKFKYDEKAFPLNLDVDWLNYKYEVKIENGNLKFLKYFFRNYYIDGKLESRLRVLQVLSSSLKDLTSNLINHCNYKKHFSYFYVRSNSSSPYQNESFIRNTKKYQYDGTEEENITEKPNAIFFTIEFSNKNLVCDKLFNAFTHLLNLTINNPKYNTEEAIVDNDPFANPVKKDTATINPIRIPTSNALPMTKSGGVYKIPVLINGVLKLDFIFDAGAADVSIPPDVALTLIRTGTVTDKDFLGTETYRFGNGSTAKSKVFLIKEIQLGNKKVNNVKASIANSVDAPLLLGQSVLNKFGKVTIDYNKGLIVFEN